MVYPGSKLVVTCLPWEPRVKRVKRGTNILGSIHVGHDCVMWVFVLLPTPVVTGAFAFASWNLSWNERAKRSRSVATTSKQGPIP